MDRKVAAAALSVASNAFLLAIKAVVGLLTGSVSVLSAAADSLNDLTASFVSFFSVKASAKPADTEHPYGHGKIENLSSAIQAVLILGAGGYIVWQAISKILHPRPIETIGLGLAVMAVTAFVDLAISRHLLRVAIDTDSAALKANAYHLTTDVWTALAVFLGLIVVRFTGYEILDPIIALAVAAAVLKVGFELTLESAGVLLDARLPDEEIRALHEIVSHTPNVIGYHKLRTRKAGAHREIDLHLIVPAEMTVMDAHNIAQQVEDRVADAFPQVNVVTHIEPDTPDNLEPDNHLDTPLPS